MKFKIGCAAFIGLCLLNQAVSAANDKISYKNTRGSILELEFSGSDTLTGTFTTAVATKECQKVIGVKRPITGYIVNNVISFSVDYPDCGSVVAFIGNLGKNRETIETTALVAHQPAQLFGTQFIGHDSFNRI